MISESHYTGADAVVLVGETVSLCPHCLRQVPGFLERSGDDVFLSKTCPDHGATRTPIWRGPPDFDEWRRDADAPPSVHGECPTLCGPCTDHRQSTCCLLLEVTARCDLACPVCFAGSGPVAGEDPSLAEIEGWFARLAGSAPGCNIQLSGGEPTVRDDLPRILELGRRHGFTFFQLNSNGLRLAREEGYAASLAQAGLSTVFLQFDGVDDAPYVALRGAPLLSLKLAAVEACAAAGLGVVLVPTLVPGVNTHQIGAIVDLAIAHLPAVRGVHLQPVSYFGRAEGVGSVAAAPRITLPEVLRAVVDQTGGRLPARGFRPAACEHPACSFHGEFVQAADGGIVPLRDRPDAATTEVRERTAATEKARRTAARWTTAKQELRCCCKAPPPPDSRPHGGVTDASHGPQGPADAWERALTEIRGRTFSVTAMAFQDAWNIDLERLQSCCLHVLSRDLRRVPFCAYNLTAADGSHLHGRWLGRDDLAAEAVQGRSPR